MARVKRGVTAHARHKKVLEKAAGFYELAGVQMDRKVLADIAGNDPVGFKAIADKVRAALA